MTEIIYRVNPVVSNDELNALFSASDSRHAAMDFQPVLARNLAFVCAFDADRLVGFVKIAWDEDVHAFLLDPTVRPEYRRRGIGTELVRQATAVARERGMQWLHVDFEPHLQEFYDQCGFRQTNAGLIDLHNHAE